MKSSWVIALLLCFGACGDSAESTIDAATSLDAQGSIDAGENLPDAQDSDGGAPDAAPGDVDAGITTLGPVDCINNEDCPTSNCNQSAPGGVCLDCAGENCDSGFVCNFGACIRECDDDGDCNTGKRCTNGGLCVIRRCSDIAPCPAPYSCNLELELCNRPACSAGQCPAGLTCDTASNLCVEI